MTRKIPVTINTNSKPIRVVSKEPVELDNAHGREKINVYCYMDKTGEGDRTR